MDFYVRIFLLISKNPAVSAFYAIGSNGGGILCNFLGGIVMDLYGSAGLYLFFGILNVIGVILYFIFGLHKSEKKGKSN